MKTCLILLITFVQSYVARAQKADLVLKNGTIITLSGSGSRASALAIKDGLVLATGNDLGMEKYISKSTRVVDLKGATVIPGFNNVHQHPSPLYNWDKPYATLRLDTVSSMQGLIALLKRKAAITPKGYLIRGEGYNELKLGGQPTKDILDQASTEHPFEITHASGHLSAVNSFVLQKNNITKDTRDPSGGAFDRDKNGEPDGIVKESARRLLQAADLSFTQHPGLEEELQGYRDYFNQLLASGITSLGDCWVTPEKYRIYKTLEAQHFPLRFNLYIGSDFLEDVISGKIPVQHTDNLTVAGIKLFHGNSLSGKTCWLTEPYDMINPTTGQYDYFGIPPARSQQALDSVVLAIHQAGLQLACHSNGDREISMVLKAIEYAQRVYHRKDTRHRIEHCSIVTIAILENIKKDGVIPVFHCYLNELGNQLLVYTRQKNSLLIPTHTALQMKIPFALHSDYPVSRYESMTRLCSAVNRTNGDGTILGAGEQLSPEQAIYAYTSGGAYTTHEENKKGKLIPGFFADMVVLEKDPTRVEPAAIDRIRVLATYVGGKEVFHQD